MQTVIHFFKQTWVKKIILLFLGWRISLFVISIVADHFLIYDPSFPYANTILANHNLPRWLYSWANFDGVHYLTIAEKGYLGTGLIQAFFPIYPLFVSLMATVLGNLLVSGLLLSSGAFLSLMIVWYLLVRLDWNHKIAWLSLILLIVFPTSFYFGALYSESIFLLLTLSAFLAARYQKWLLATFFIAIASATRVVGVFLIPALVLECFIQYLEVNKVKYSVEKITKNVLPFIKNSWRKITLLSLGSIGLLAYMFFLYQEFKDPLYFFHVQSEFGGGRQETLVLFPQVIWRYIKILFTYRPFDLKYIIFVQELILSLMTLLVLIYGILKVRWSYLLYSFSVFFIPTLTGNLSSMPRYVLVCFAMFIIMAEVLSKRKAAYFWIGLSTFWLVFNTILFIQGYWVA